MMGSRLVCRFRSSPTTIFSDCSRLMATVNWLWFPCMVAIEAAMLSITARRYAICSSTVLALGGVDVAMATRVGRKLGARQQWRVEVAWRAAAAAAGGSGYQDGMARDGQSQVNPEPVGPRIDFCLFYSL
jgi:hypothetical protein